MYFDTFHIITIMDLYVVNTMYKWLIFNIPTHQTQICTCVNVISNKGRIPYQNKNSKTAEIMICNNYLKYAYN